MSSTNLRQGNLFKTLIYQEELDHIAGWVEDYPNLETGGDLFGFWTHSGFPVIQFVLGPGKTSRHNPASFYQDREHLIKAGELLRGKHGLQHIGEWHSHHQMGLAQPSGGDEQTVFNALRQYNFPKFLLCIANLRPQAESLGRTKYIVNVGCFLFTASYPRYQPGAWVVLPNHSPIRRDVRCGENQILFNSPGLNKNWKVEETTLEAQPLFSTEPIVISEDIWYSTPKGKSLLKEIFEGLNSRYQNCEMLRTSSEEIYFTFEIKNNSLTDKWRIDFPHNFPQDSPQVKVNYFEPAGIQNWQGNFQQLEQIEDCIKRYYKGQWR
ncbi:Mov34/MPN/PAD-1 family protein [Planktothrix agardhii]|uniref:JAB domain-containing protein n=1 Tax=Planktothrix agardhii (strain NIVA-CYA 126/8) TaxID=388467 RepID=A0A073CGS4_PLAA1|nr:Mov34/MPN/PAD-1 family protein [Planktothrix agardhii]KEI67514.1 hypothetical protein A19Y_2624 [Planktothrix agardhii NIVA-CYA 126/8]CAD5950711.1 hypothetical protein NIVACYA_02981 [Planktothrix agardhii]